MVDEYDETPTNQMPAMSNALVPNHDDPSMQAVLVAMNAVLREMKGLRRTIEAMNTTLNVHVTDIAVIKVQNQGQANLIQSLASRVDALEKERDELTKSVLAKAITLVLLLSAAIAAAVWFITHKSGG